MNTIWENTEYPFLYDTHVHTKQGSACGKCSGAEMARAYKKAGYAGIIITDHFYYGNTAVSHELPWEEWVNAYCKGYEEAKAEGERIGLQVFFGWESGYRGTEFLIYGLDKEWLLYHPQIKDASIREQYQMVNQDEGLVIHAHPFREENYIKEIRLFPECVDGVELMNACHSNPDSTAHYNPEYDKQAYEYATKHHFMVTSGSDMHTTQLLGGGMAFSTRLQDSKDFILRVQKKETYMLTDGHSTYLYTGNLEI